MTPKAGKTKEKQIKVDFIKTKTSTHQRMLSRDRKDNPQSEIFVNHITSKALVYRIYRPFTMH